MSGNSFQGRRMDVMIKPGFRRREIRKKACGFRQTIDILPLSRIQGSSCSRKINRVSFDPACFNNVSLTQADKLGARTTHIDPQGHYSLEIHSRMQQDEVLSLSLPMSEMTQGPLPYEC